MGFSRKNQTIKYYGVFVKRKGPVPIINSKFQTKKQIIIEPRIMKPRKCLACGNPHFEFNYLCSSCTLRTKGMVKTICLDCGREFRKTNSHMKRCADPCSKIRIKLRDFLARANHYDAIRKEMHTTKKDVLRDISTKKLIEIIIRDFDKKGKDYLINAGVRNIS